MMHRMCATGEAMKFPEIRFTGPAMFWLFWIVVVICSTIFFLKAPQPVVNAMTRIALAPKPPRPTTPDPLALRIEALRKLNVGHGTADQINQAEQTALKAVTDQWADEVKQLGEAAYDRTRWQQVVEPPDPVLVPQDVPAEVVKRDDGGKWETRW